MNYLYNKVNQMLSNRKINGRVIAFITALSLIMTFIVPYAEFIPTKAITVNTPIENMIMTADDNTTVWFENVQTDLLGDNLNGKITEI